MAFNPDYRVEQSSGYSSALESAPLGGDRYARRGLTNGHRGPTTLDLPGTGYSTDTYFKGAYVAEKEELAQKAEIIVVRTKLWTPPTAHEMIERAFAQSDPQNASWIGFRKTDAPQGEYEGFTWSEGVTIPTTKRDIQTIHMIIRAFDPAIQGIHFGRIAMQLTISNYPEADKIDHRSASAIAIRSFLESGVVKRGRRFPFDLPYDADDEMSQVLLWLYTRFHTRGKMPNFTTGVSKGDYIEPNGAIPADIHGPAQEIQSWLVEKKTVIVNGEKKRGLGMDLPNGDALYEASDLAQIL